jgi:hypothetical protein
VRHSKRFSCKVRCGMALFAMLGISVAMGTRQAAGQSSAANDKDKNDEGGLQIEPTELPRTQLRVPYRVQLYGRGNYVPTLRWRVVKGKLPPGMTLTDGGLLHGEAQKTGEFNFVVGVRDGNQPPQAVQRGFVIEVEDALTVAWKVPAHVSGNRIEGSVEVSNTTADDIDLTYDVKAIAENGRATEIGYQHFPLKQGTMGMTLPFGETLPPGDYVVNVSVEGMIVKRKTFYRQGLQTPGPLQVTVEP